MRFVPSSDGTQLAVEETGEPGGRPVVLLHGIAQSRHVWRPLVEGRLAQSGARFLAVDLRGHGDSDAPARREAYGPGVLGEDLAAVIAGLDRPVVVAWSYAGVAIGEYLRAHGGRELGGVMLVAAATSVGKTAQGRYGAVMMDNVRALMSEDANIYEQGVRTFLAGCASKPIPAAFVEDAVARMLPVPAVVRRSLLSRSEDFSEDIARCDVALSVVHGTEDRVVLPSVGQDAAKLRPDAKLLLLEGVGHVPWVESKERFEDALEALLPTPHT